MCETGFLDVGLCFLTPIPETSALPSPHNAAQMLDLQVSRTSGRKEVVPLIALMYSAKSERCASMEQFGTRI